MLCKELSTFDLESLETALNKQGTFIVKINQTSSAAISWWVSAKRTRSYPYARVYDSLNYSGKKITIIPIFKDEGLEGDRDFLQWDTISLMSLLGVYVIIGYYTHAEPSTRYKNKITKQRFDIEYIKSQLNAIASFQSDALHWNLEQVNNVGNIASIAVKHYKEISARLNIDMHSINSAEQRVGELLKGKANFMSISRASAMEAQARETNTIQPKEFLSGTKASITINNYLGGYYYFTADESYVSGQDIYLIEGKHSKYNSLPSISDIKDGLLKMILFSNLKDVKLNDTLYSPKPVLKLTFDGIYSSDSLNKHDNLVIGVLKKEATLNGFEIRIN